MYGEKQRLIWIVNLIVVLCCIFAVPVAAQEEITVRVRKVIDGDSFTAIHDGRRVEVRLWGVDCPEWNQPYAHKARKQTRRMIEKKSVSLQVKGRDQYGRLIATVHTGRRNVNAELVKAGSAWVYTRYCNEPVCKTWKKFQGQAKRGKKGLWRKTDAVPPWQWRKRNHR